MNLAVNHIKPSEIRSASVVSAKAMLQISAFIVPLSMTVFIGLAYLKKVEYQSKAELQQSAWNDAEMRVNQAVALGQTLILRKQAVQEVRGWQTSRIAWSEVLAALRPMVPASVQLKALQARQSFEPGLDGHAVRACRIVMNGRCEGPDAENKVESLRQSMATHPMLSVWVGNVRVAAFSEDMEKGASADDRAFQVELDFLVRSLHAASTE